MICPHCGATLSSAARFCTQCGQTLAVAAANSNDNVEDSTVLSSAPHGTAAAPQPEAPAPVAAFPEPVPAPQAAAPQPEPAPAFPGAAPQPEPAFPAVPEPVPAQEAPAAPVPAAEVPVAAPAGEVPAAAPVAAAAPAPGTFAAPAPGAPVPGAPAPVTPGAPGAPVQPGAPQQFVPNPMFKELFSARSLQTAAISLAFGLIGAMALALIGSIFFLSAGSSWASKLSMVPGLSHMMSDASGSGTVTPNFFQFLILVMVLGVSGQLSPNITGGNLSMSSFGVSGHLWMPVGLSGVALVLGTAFGAYWFARKFAIRFKWTGIVSSVIVGVVMGFVYLILAAIFPLTLGAGSMGGMGGIQAKAILTGVSARTYFMTLLLAAIGAFFGYLLAQYASDSNNVFTAAWKWAHRTRGFVRTLLDAAFIYAVVFTVIGFICLIMLSSSLHNGQMFMLFPILLPYLSFLTFALGSFGAVGITASGNIANLSLFGFSNQYVGSISAPWQLWLVFVVFLITTFYIALRAAARNIYDPAYAGWQHSWKSPVATLVIWLIVTFLFTSVTLGYTMQSDTSDVSLNIAAWYFLVAAVWSFLIEVVALTFGPAMVLSMGGAWKLFVGGTVRPTPPRRGHRVCGGMRSALWSLPVTGRRGRRLHRPAAVLRRTAWRRCRSADRARSWHPGSGRSRSGRSRSGGSHCRHRRRGLSGPRWCPDCPSSCRRSCRSCSCTCRPRSGGCSRRPGCSQGHDPAAEEAGHHHQRHRRRACPARYRLRSGQLHRVQRR